MILVINTGGTFNKIYHPIKGKLVVPKNNNAIGNILKSFYNNLNFKIKGIIYKDSLDMTREDRKKLLEEIEKTKYKKIIIVHGTDTMHVSAKFLADNLKEIDKCIVFTGAMEPYSINQTEATANSILAVSKTLYNYENGIFIAMHGLVLPYNKIVKNRKKGKFERISY